MYAMNRKRQLEGKRKLGEVEEDGTGGEDGEARTGGSIHTEL